MITLPVLLMYYILLLSVICLVYKTSQALFMPFKDCSAPIYLLSKLFPYIFLNEVIKI